MARNRPAWRLRRFHNLPVTLDWSRTSCCLCWAGGGPMLIPERLLTNVAFCFSGAVFSFQHDSCHHLRRCHHLGPAPENRCGRGKPFSVSACAIFVCEFCTGRMNSASRRHLSHLQSSLLPTGILAQTGRRPCSDFPLFMLEVRRTHLPQAGSARSATTAEHVTVDLCLRDVGQLAEPTTPDWARGTTTEWATWRSTAAGTAHNSANACEECRGDACPNEATEGRETGRRTDRWTDRRRALPERVPTQAIGPTSGPLWMSPGFQGKGAPHRIQDAPPNHGPASASQGLQQAVVSVRGALRHGNRAGDDGLAEQLVWEVSRRLSCDASGGDGEERRNYMSTIMSRFPSALCAEPCLPQSDKQRAVRARPASVARVQAPECAACARVAQAGASLRVAARTSGDARRWPS